MGLWLTACVSVLDELLLFLLPSFPRGYRLPSGCADEHVVGLAILFSFRARKVLLDDIITEEKAADAGLFFQRIYECFLAVES